MKTIIHIVSAFVIFFSSEKLVAQMPVATVSPPFENPMYGDIIKTATGYITVEPVNMKAQMFYSMTLNKIKFGIKVQAYDNNMKMVSESRLENGSDDFGPFVPELEEIDGRVFVISYKFTKGESGDISVVLNELNTLTLAVTKEQQLFAIPIKNLYAFKTFDLLVGAETLFSHSTDKKKMAAVWYSSLNNEVHVSLLDKGEVAWQKNEVLEIKGSIQVLSVAADNSGNVFFTYKSKGKDVGNRAIVMDGKKKVDAEVKVRSATPFESFILPSASGDYVHLVGTYTSAHKNLNGVFRQKLKSTDFKILAESTSEFQEDLVQKLDKLGWATTKEKRYGINEIHLTAYLLPGDNIAMVGEFKSENTYMRPNSALGNAAYQTRQYYFTGSILILQLLNNNLMATVLPKERTGANSPLGQSTFSYPYNNKLYVFYNDYRKNLETENEKFVNGIEHTKLVLGVAEISSDGSYKKAVVSDLTKQYFLHLPMSATSLSPGTIQIDGVQLKLSMSGYVGKKSVVTVIKFE